MDILNFVFPFIVDGHLDCLYCGAILNDMAIKVSVQVFVWTYVFNCFEYTPRSGTAGSFGNSVFNFLRKSQTVCRSSYTTYDPVSSL